MYSVFIIFVIDNGGVFCMVVIFGVFVCYLVVVFILEDGWFVVVIV